MLKFITDNWPLIAGVALALCLITASETNGQEAPGHSKHHSDFYSTLKMKNGASCCNDKDCRPLFNYRKTSKGLWQIQEKAGGPWQTPPQGVIQYKTTPDGEAHACFEDHNGLPWQDDRGRVWYCVIIPFMGY